MRRPRCFMMFANLFGTFDCLRPIRHQWRNRLLSNFFVRRVVRFEHVGDCFLSVVSRLIRLRCVAAMQQQSELKTWS